MSQQNQLPQNVPLFRPPPPFPPGVVSSHFSFGAANSNICDGQPQRPSHILGEYHRHQQHFGNDQQSQNEENAEEEDEPEQKHQQKDSQQNGAKNGNLIA
ncbi:hypothetical protein niasHT_001251 [Heterodera trifolii]|uniref:Uncharacterized protein n=1 Tax=Heterodera trifolii TaxID=157864 RepID=A0ABD2M6G2_9BILA